MKHQVLLLLKLPASRQLMILAQVKDQCYFIVGDNKEVNHGQDSDLLACFLQMVLALLPN